MIEALVELVAAIPLQVVFTVLATVLIRFFAGPAAGWATPLLLGPVLGVLAGSLLPAPRGHHAASLTAAPGPARGPLSVLVPVFNERATIERLLAAVAAVRTPVPLEILVGDDGSTDGTRELLSHLNVPGLQVFLMPRNVGRGGVLKALWTHATGDIIVHQDADLEYDPADFNRLLEPILAGRADVVYGSRFKGSIEHMRWPNRVGNLVMTGASRALYGVDISDLMTCYKMYRASAIRDLHIVADGFDFEAEFTARLAQRGARFAEVPVRFSGRTFEEGKKIRAFDAVRVMRELVRCKFSGERRA